MSKSIKQCKHCMKTYERGFWGTGIKYCSIECRKLSKKYYLRTYYHTHKKHIDRPCLLCKRISHGKRRVYKYCSQRCMVMAQGMRGRESKFVTIKIPAKDIPFIFGGFK